MGKALISNLIDNFKPILFIQIFLVWIFTAHGELWQSFTPMNSPVDLEYHDGCIWGATDGGMFHFSIQDSTFDLITRADGLLGQEFYCLEPDTLFLNGDTTVNIWCSGWGAALNIYYPAEERLITLTDLGDYADKVQDIVTGNGSVFAASDMGVSELFYHEQYGEYLFKGTYSQWGNSALGHDARVLSLHDGYLWVGLEEGVARAFLDSPNLVLPSAWETFTVEDGLPEGSISGFAVVRDTMWVGTYNHGIARFEGDHFTLFSSGLQINEMRAFDDTIYVASLGGVKRFVDNGWQSFSENGISYRTICRDANGRFWAGKTHKRFQYGGLQGRTENGWLDYPVNTPAGKRISGLMFDSQGKLWCAATPAVGKGVYIYDYFDWLNFTPQIAEYDTYFYSYTGGNGEGPRTLLEYPNGEVWVGSFGSGLAVFLPTGEQRYFNYSDSLSYENYARLPGISVNPAYVVIGEMVLDDDDNIWLINRETLSDEPLVVVPAAFMVEHSYSTQWIYYNFSEIGSGDSYLDYLVQDHMGRLWMAGDHEFVSGLTVFDFGGTPFDKSDDWHQRLTKSANNLLSNQIYDLAIDRDNMMWVATPFGVNFFQIPDDNSEIPSIYASEQYDLYGTKVNCIAVDPMNNKWFGTDNGVGFVPADNYGIYYYTEDNSPLLSNNIINIIFNPATGEAFISTSEGLSVLQTPYREFGETLGEIDVRPSPFFIGEGDVLRFYGNSLTEDSSVKIFTSTGLLVKELSSLEASLGWDGTDRKNRLVGNGIYLILVVTDQGESAVGKVAVLRK